ncbi:MAG: hypothetical protein J7M34_00165 [Anaerolineae bacterium]|nr:hypothetical protein [Anaerolineae bacterium]
MLGAGLASSVSNSSQPKVGGQALDIALLTFVRRFADNMVRWDIVAYFSQNPEAESTVQDIARWAGRRQRVIRAELEDLVLLGLLEVKEVAGKRVYKLTDDFGLRQIIQRFGEQLADGLSKAGGPPAVG